MDMRSCFIIDVGWLDCRWLFDYFLLGKGDKLNFQD